MTLYTQIKEDLITAMKSKDSQTLSVLRLLTASLKNKMIELKREMEDDDVLSAIRSDVKKLEDAMTDFAKAAREDLVDSSKAEIAVLKKYLPAEMSKEELEEKVRAVLGDGGFETAEDIGKAMGAVMGKLKGMVDGNRVREMVEQVLKGDEEKK
ncbi:aspartyl-tRNA amidotransferase [Candidatus Uhrbacteria bacterium CG_4_10_14_0_2_um_filter_41_7]|uniref:Aspartyl-tRNA amidotransferase n=1 Tax=Candidatus Uhrbacteria bacterium CG_4_9_14_3_um_filter_41_35 TaxID=1975034 RepID=A0A2M7XFZ6_9BACT|nr:MAG: aspartyl-tRNA amidotransferase [Candidatus Uhrbacteria bacterium CG11_big_fil_rev_8_21_14_0_20_41_9]PIZ55556.1 MAG: aspartyl-tRNA amidotransferase [Candidatus Uhrbacteria bacterium CG_4_10_14_0_2_um_filter_41_7]PJA46797.1 MAG: aspartyl-tRNA amidotransferase [Candidatus Uhrbacteria bacterium CG_4_9_14_3_um_filter_41_35]